MAIYLRARRLSAPSAPCLLESVPLVPCSTRSALSVAIIHFALGIIIRIPRASAATRRLGGARTRARDGNRRYAPACVVFVIAPSRSAPTIPILRERSQHG